MFRCFFLVCLLAFMQGCGSSKKWPREVVRVGIDSHWHPMDFGPQQPYVNGFIEELLLEISSSIGVEFERIEANWDSLYEDMKEKKYDAVLGSLPSYDFNTAQYDFSRAFLNFGPVLIVASGRAPLVLHEMRGKRVGIISGDSALPILQKIPDVVVSQYSSIPKLLEAVVEGRIEGAFIDRIPAARYIADLFAGKLVIASGSLTDAALRLIVLKDSHRRLIAQFNQSLDGLTKKRKLQYLLQKWGLAEKSAEPKERV